MTRNVFIAHVKRLYNTEPESPFDTDLDTLVFRHSDNRKWFAIVMSIPFSKLEKDGEGIAEVVNFKCDRDVIQSLWQENGIYPAYHMSKAHWITVALDDRVSDETIIWLLEMSFKLTKKKINIKKAE
jgi:predicted DNA-binding protein (MmcQ/YjbR family)